MGHIGKVRAFVTGAGAAALASTLVACFSSSSSGPQPDAAVEPDATMDGPAGDDSGALPRDGAADNGNGNPDGGSTPEAGATACADAASGPLGLTCADFPGVDPCPNQGLLTDSAKFSALQTAMKSGVLLYSSVPYGSDPNIYKQKCGLEGFWDPAKATQLVPPATPIPELAALFAPSSDGNAGVCASYAPEGPTSDGFPAPGTYRLQFHAAYQGQTYVVRARAQVSGSAAGQSFVAAGIYDGGSTAALAGGLFYQVGGAAAAEGTLWPSLVDALASSASTFPSATLTVSTASGGAPVWTGVLQILCASQKAEADAGPAVITVEDTISVAGSPGALTFDTGTKKAYVALSSRSDAGFTVSGGIAVLSDTTAAVVGNIPTSGLAVALAANGTTNTVYASEQTTLDVIASSSDTITTTVTVNAEGMAVDEANDLVYVLGGSSIAVLDGATNMLTGTTIPFTGMTVPTAAFSGGKPAIALDPTSGTLYAIGLDSSLNGVIKTFSTASHAQTNSQTITGWQPQSIAVVPGIGAVAGGVASSGGGGVLLVGQSTPVTTAFNVGSVARCGTTIAVVGSDGTGLAGFSTFAPTAASVGTAAAFDATELNANGGVPAALLTAAAAATGCTFYGTYDYNYNALYSGGSTYTPPPPPLVVKYTNY